MVSKIRSHVRDGQFIVELETEEALSSVEVGLCLNGEFVAKGQLTPVSMLCLRAVIPPGRITDLDVFVFAKTGPTKVLGKFSEHHIARIVCQDFEEFRNNVMRKDTRIKDSMTLLEAARQGYLNPKSGLQEKAVSLAVIGYRYVEAPDSPPYTSINWIIAESNRLRESIDEQVPEEARWATSIDVMLYQVCAMAGQTDSALIYLYRLFASRMLVEVEPMCAYNISLGIHLLGYLYFVADRFHESRQIWNAYEHLFVTAVVRQPKGVGTMRELGVIWKHCYACVSGISVAVNAKKGQASNIKGASKITDDGVAAACLRVNLEFSAKAQKRIVDWITEVRQRKIILLPAEEVLSSATFCYIVRSTELLLPVEN